MTQNEAVKSVIWGQTVAERLEWILARRASERGLKLDAFSASIGLAASQLRILIKRAKDAERAMVTAAQKGKEPDRIAAGLSAGTAARLAQQLDFSLDWLLLGRGVPSARDVETLDDERRHKRMVPSTPPPSSATEESGEVTLSPSGTMRLVSPKRS